MRTLRVEHYLSKFAAVSVAVAAALGSCLVLLAGPAVASSCSYHQSGNHWVCVTPGAYCPKAAHGHYGLDRYNVARKYWCENKNGRRWEPNR